MSSRTTRTTIALVATAAVAACSTNISISPTTAAPTTPSATTSTALSGSITVFAAASLKEVFGKIANQFEAANPGTKVTFSFAASSALAAQITSGAPADVFAAASAATMDLVVAAGLAQGPIDFAKNTMEIAVPPRNPAAVLALVDLTKSGVKLAICQPLVPCGSTALKVFNNAKLKVTPATLEPDVKSVLNKVEMGEADAGIVYVTDALAAGTKVLGIAIPAADNASTQYPIVALSKGSNSALAQAFVAYVLSADGFAALAAAGFARP